MNTSSSITLSLLFLTLTNAHRWGSSSRSSTPRWGSSSSKKNWHRWSKGWSESSSEERAPAPGCATEIGHCGCDWYDADECGTCCNTNDDCTEPNQFCYGDMLNETPCTALDKTNSVGRCGDGWEDAAKKCGQYCNIDTDCTDIPGEKCYGKLENEWIRDPCDDSSDSIGIKAISGCGTGKKVALTFDDGPAIYHSETQTIIDKIAELNAMRAANQLPLIVATFYVSPNSHKHWNTPPTCELIKSITEAGHEVQSHSFNHRNFAEMTLAQIERDLIKNKQFITQCGGAAPTIFRPPYGELDVERARFINQQGYVLGFWNLDTKDYECISCADIVANIDLSKYGDDSVNILMHDRYVYGCIEEIVAAFEGYEFVTQSECYNECDTMENAICADTNGNNYWLIDEWLN